MEKHQNLKGLKKLLSYAKKWTPLTLLSALFMIFAETSVLISYTFLGKALDFVMGNGDFKPQTTLVLTMLIAAFSGIFGMLSLNFLEWARNGFTFSFYRLVVRHISKLPMSYYDKVKSGDLVSRIENDMFWLRDLFAYTGKSVLSGTIMVIITFCYLLIHNLMIGLINIALIVGLLLLSNKVGNICRKTYRQMLQSLGAANGVASDSIQGVREVKAFNAVARETGKFDCAMALAHRERDKLNKWDNFSNALSELSGIMPQLVTFGIGGYMAIQGTISVGSVLAMQLAINTLRNSLKYLTYYWTVFIRTLAGAERMFEILDEDTEEKTWAEDKKRAGKNSDGAEVRFNNVCFSYPTRKDEGVLNDLSFSIKRGEKVAIVGESGCGKSTVSKLLTGFYKADSGEIYYNGTEIGGMTLSDLRRNISIVSQDAFLFPVTIHNNISYGKGCGVKGSDGEIGDVEISEDVLKASKDAQLHDFVMSLPKKYESLVGERGVKLSGGQQQRVSIARAMMKNAEFLILDEPTSALDSFTEHQIQEALNKLIEGKTAIIIAHRLSSIKNADRILVMKDGRVIESGTHRELIGLNGEYYNLYNSQIKEESDEEGSVGLIG